MSKLREKAPFQAKVAIAILALVLVMVIMNFAANRTLSRVIQELRESTREKLTTVALRVSEELEEDSATSILTSLNALVARENIDYAFVLDSALVEVASSPEKFSRASRQRIRKILFSVGVSGAFLKNKYQFTYRRDSESEWAVFHCPVTSGGRWRILVIAGRTTALASVEREVRYLLISGFAIVILLSLGVFALFRGVTSPFKRISDSVAEVSAITGVRDVESAVDELVLKHKQTIEQLRNKEVRLLELNERLEDRLGDVERFNDSLLGAISTGVVVLDNQGRLIGINGNARTYLSKTFRAPIDSGTSDVQLSESHNADSNEDVSNSGDDYVGVFSEYPEIKKRVEGLLLDSTGDTSDFEYQETAPDGSINTFRVSLMPLMGAKDSLRELMLLISDQTEVTRAQQRLEDSRQLATLGEMSAGLAHQLRNSISAAMGFSSLVKRKAEKSDLRGSVEPLDSLLKELQDEAALVDRFLSFAKPLALAVERTTITVFLTESLTAYQGKTLPGRTQNGSLVNLNVETDGEIELDTLLLKQVIVNLVDNALRASEASHSPVDVTANVSETEVVIVISDYGCGISASEQQKIFTPFYSSSPSGAGLGLPLARKIVELHGGVLELVSRPDCGATFTIHLPRYHDACVSHTNESVQSIKAS